MADAEYAARVDKVCAQLGITNPIDKDSLTTNALLFLFDHEPQLLVEKTDMNLAGIAFFEARATERDSLRLDAEFREEAESYFPAVAWNDCNREKRQVTYGAKRANRVVVIRRQAAPANTRERGTNPVGEA